MSVKRNTPRDMKMREEISFQSDESGAGQQFLLQDCRAKAGIKGVFLFTDTGMIYEINALLRAQDDTARCSNMEIAYRGSLCPVVICPDLCSSDMLYKECCIICHII